MKAIFNYPQEFKTLPEYTAHAGQTVTVGDQLSEKEADCGDGLERMFHITAPDGWKGHAFESELKILTPVRELGCCCCGNSTRGRQWWNRDTGYGICPECIEYVKKQGMKPEEIRENYGIQGIHYDVERAA